MSIKLRFEKGSLSTQVTLNDEAIGGLLKLIAEHQSDDDVPQRAPEPLAPMGESVRDLSDPSKEQDRLNLARSWMKEHSESESLSKIGWNTFAEQILILGAHHEAATGETGWKSATIEDRFKAARIPAPGNFARDISTAIKNGLVATVTPRTYKVSKTGWLKIYEAIIETTVRASVENKQK
ncbi:MAG TPA: hypothetical protein VH280_17885 [Verrucomicrobiae bacterium]|jgi:hypothetical protein|nr:hypothetical protein [Verrucomicrobiae bacterium]